LADVLTARRVIADIGWIDAGGAEIVLPDALFVTLWTHHHLYPNADAGCSGAGRAFGWLQTSIRFGRGSGLKRCTISAHDRLELAVGLHDDTTYICSNGSGWIRLPQRVTGLRFHPTSGARKNGTALIDNFLSRSKTFGN
jgi:hypothetical protein